MTEKKCKHPNLTIDKDFDKWLVQLSYEKEKTKEDYEGLMGGVYRCVECGKKVFIITASVYPKETKNGL